MSLVRFIVIRHEIISDSVSCLSIRVKMAECTPVQYGITADEFAQAYRNISPKSQLIFVRPVMKNGNCDHVEPSVDADNRHEKIEGKSTSPKQTFGLPLSAAGFSHSETNNETEESWSAVVSCVARKIRIDLVRLFDSFNF